MVQPGRKAPTVPVCARFLLKFGFAIALLHGNMIAQYPNRQGGVVRGVRFPEPQLRQLLSLTSKLAWTAQSSRKPKYLHGLCESVGASLGILALLGDDFSVVGDTVCQPKSAELDSGRFLSFANPILKPFLELAALRHLEPTATTRRGVVDDSSWYTSEFFTETLIPMGLDDCILSIVPLAGLRPFIGVVLLVGDQNRKRPFTSRHRRLIEIAQAELRWIYYPHPLLGGGQLLETAPADLPKGLAPRYQRLLGHLLAGTSEKELATQLGLSRHTVHAYIREIYKTSGVSSRAELMAQWISDDSVPNGK
jgi:DNA-binding CsgD family transcriptional regulator